MGPRDDVTRLEEQRSRLSRCPLGSGAIAGCALPIDRHNLAANLGFKDITPNSMFAVSSRDHFGKQALKKGKIIFFNRALPNFFSFVFCHSGVFELGISLRSTP